MNRVNDFYLGFKFALSYFSIIPISFKDDVDLSKKEILNYFLFSLPFVGLILGSITLIAYSFLDSIPWLGAIICAGLYMILYGFIHTEAILDVVDAMYAKHSGKDAYKVIKDPTIGAMGLLYSLVLVIIKLATIVYLFSNDFLLEFLAILIISRICIQVTIYFFTFKSSFLSTLKNSFETKSFFISLLISSLIIVILTNFNFLWLLVLGLLLAILITNFIKKSLAFINGDVLGTILELIEITLFLVLCYIWL